MCFQFFFQILSRNQILNSFVERVKKCNNGEWKRKCIIKIKNKIAECMKEKVMGYNLTSFPYVFRTILSRRWMLYDFSIVIWVLNCFVLTFRSFMQLCLLKYTKLKSNSPNFFHMQNTSENVRKYLLAL